MTHQTRPAPPPAAPGEAVAACSAAGAGPAGPPPATRPCNSIANPCDAIPPPPVERPTGSAQPDAPADTWITKEAGNRRLPFDRARLERSIDAIHAEFPQLDVADYKRSVFGFVERKATVNADDLVDHLIREAEARVDLTAPEWEHFAARIYLHRLYKRASRAALARKYGSCVGAQEAWPTATSTPTASAPPPGSWGRPNAWIDQARPAVPLGCTCWPRAPGHRQRRNVYELPQGAG